MKLRLDEPLTLVYLFRGTVWTSKAAQYFLPQHAFISTSIRHRLLQRRIQSSSFARQSSKPLAVRIIAYSKGPSTTKKFTLPSQDEDVPVVDKIHAAPVESLSTMHIESHSTSIHESLADWSSTYPMVRINPSLSYPPTSLENTHSTQDDSNASQFLPVVADNVDFHTQAQFNHLISMLSSHLKHPLHLMSEFEILHEVNQGEFSPPVSLSALPSTHNSILDGQSCSTVKKNNETGIDFGDTGLDDVSNEDPWVIYRSLTLDYNVLLKTPRDTFTLLLRYAAHTKQTPGMCMDHINALMQDMSLCHVIPTESEWRLVIWAYIKSGSLDLCETIIEQSNDWCAQFDKVLWEKVDVGSDPHTHEVDRAHMAIKNASHINQVSTRAIFFDILSQALISVGKSHSLWLLVKALAGPIDSVDGEWSYTNVGSIDSFEVLIGLFYNLRLPDRCISVIEAMRNQGISPTHQCYIYTIESMVNCYTTHNTLGLEFTEKGTPSFDQHEAAKTVSEFYCNIPTDRLTLPIIENVLIITEHIPSQSLLPRIWYDIQKLSAQFKEATYWSLCKSYLVCQCGTYFSLLALDIFRHFLARRDLIPNPHNQAHHERFLLMCLEHHHAVVYSAHFRLMLGTGVRIDSAICTRALEMTPDKHLRIPILRYMWVNEMDVPVHI